MIERPDTIALAAPAGPEMEPALREATMMAHVARDGGGRAGAVNPAVHRVSTVLFPTLEAYEKRFSARFLYGRLGTPTTWALEEAISGLEHSEGAVLTGSGVKAITTVLLAYAAPGAHFLVPDNAYGPVRQFCSSFLAALGVETTYYDPLASADLAPLLRPQTRLIWIEAPGSYTFEMPDIRAITKLARERGIATAIDNTWAAGHFLKPLQLGVDISVQALTKYVGGHSDLMMGAIAASGEPLKRVRDIAAKLGECVGSDDAFLALRGFRTLSTRLEHHCRGGLEVAGWLADRPEVARIMHPALPQDPGHPLWRRDFTGASGLFGFILKGATRNRLAALLDNLKLFGMGASWGGYESLLIPSDPATMRTATRWQPGGQTMRIHVGLEDPRDLIGDLGRGLALYSNAPQ